MKTGRHARILDIIAEHPIETQDELLTRLREEAFQGNAGYNFKRYQGFTPC